MKIKEWLQMMTLGQPYKYLRLMLWCLFDSIVMSIPYGLMLGAVYYLLVPLAQPGTDLPTTALWLLVGGFLVQLIAYFFIRQKTYIDASTGYAGIIKDSQITLGEHLRQLSMGFYSARDAGDLSTVLLRDYQTVGDLSQQMLPQVAVILIRFVLAAVLLAVFDWRMTVRVPEPAPDGTNQRGSAKCPAGSGVRNPGICQRHPGPAGLPYGGRPVPEPEAFL